MRISILIHLLYPLNLLCWLNSADSEGYIISRSDQHDLLLHQIPKESVTIQVRSRLDDLLLIRRWGRKGAGKVKGRREGVRGAGDWFLRCFNRISGAEQTRETCFPFILN